MKIFYEYIGSQFANPRGIMGNICCMIMNIMNRTMYNQVVNALVLKAESKVLDIGYGNGYLIKKLYDKGHGELYGIDLSEDTLKSASQKNKQGILNQKVHLDIGDCCAMKYEDEFFDAVTTVNTVYFWGETKQGLIEIFRVLKKGGVFSNTFYSKEFLHKLKYTRVGFQYFEPQEIEDLARQVGFSQVTVKAFSGGRGFMVVCKK